MSAGSMTLACLLLVAQTGTPDVFPMKDPRFFIPIRVKPEMRAEIRELLLFVSRDEGKSWHLAAKAKPDQEAFPFQATDEGSYWFSVVVVDNQDRREPADLSQAPVGQKILIDWTPPEVRVSARREGEEVLVHWEVKEQHPDTPTFKVEYHLEDMPPTQWVPVPARPNAVGDTSFKPGSAAALTVRVSVEDTAHNVGLKTVDVPSGGGPVNLLAQGAVDLRNTPPPPPPPTRQLTDPVGQPTLTASPPAQMTPLPQTTLPATAGSTAETAATQQAVATTGTNPQQAVVAQTGALAPTSQGTTPHPLPGTSSLPALQFVNKRQLRLEFEVAKFGPSGLGGVEVYQTLDEGHAWELAPVDPSSVVLPLVGDGRAGAPVRGSVTVQLQREGVVYGFYLVVKSRANLGKEPPKTGDLPQVRFELDMRAPEAKLRRPMADPNHRDVLVLLWEASDRNLTATPISLEWSEHRDGPWTFIEAAELPNTGRVNWQVPPQVPPQVYLRLSVRDLAGNVAVAQTDKPELIDLNVPEAKFVGVTAATGGH